MQRQRRSRSEMSVLQARRDSEGLTFKQLAEESGVPLGTLLSWSRKLRQESFPVHAAPAFVELHSAASAELELRLPSGATITVRPGFDAALLREVIAAATC